MIKPNTQSNETYLYTDINHLNNPLLRFCDSIDHNESGYEFTETISKIQVIPCFFTTYAAIYCLLSILLSKGSFPQIQLQ